MKGKSATRVAVLASGQGSTFEALVEADRRGEMSAEASTARLDDFRNR